MSLVDTMTTARPDLPVGNALLLKLGLYYLFLVCAYELKQISDNFCFWAHTDDDGVRIGIIQRSN